MAAIEYPELETWRLIILDENRVHLFATVHSTTSEFCLPAVRIPRWQRMAENVTKAVQQTWHWDAICLFASTLLAPLGCENRLWVVMERLRSPRVDSGLVEVPIHGLTRNSFHEGADFLMVRQALAELECYANDECAPFAQVGWFREVQNWVEQSIRALDLRPSEAIDQLNASPSFSLVRFGTNESDVWFKAVGKPNLHEFPITLELAKLFPSYLPEIIHQNPRWNAWLCLSAGRKMLAEVRDVNSWCDVAKALARLQIESVDQVETILNAGARDLRSHKLSELAEPFFDAIKVMIHGLPSHRPPLSEDELNLLYIRVQDAITLLENLNIPDTLGHLDLNPGNIVLSESGCKFLDWADAYVGNPFISFEYLSEHSKRELGLKVEFQGALSSAYIDPWQVLISSDVASEAMKYSRLIAAFAYTATLFRWEDETKLRDPEVARSLISMARRMMREATELDECVALC